MSGLRGWVLVLGILAIVGWGVYRVVQVVETRTEQMLPVRQMQVALSTQVAQALRPTPTIRPDPITVVYRVQRLARLETAQYTVEKVITAETGGEGVWGFLFGDRLLFVAHGRVVAGLDLGKIGPEDVWFEGDTLYLRLPEPEIFVVALDNDKSYVYDRKTGLLTKGNIQLESAARKAAEQAILEAALEDGILDKARVYGEAFLERFLDMLGFEKVVFVYATPTPPATPSATATP